MTPGRGAQASLWIALLTGCTTVYEGRYDFRDGWRTAEVVEVGTAGNLTRKPTGDCLQGASARPADLRFAVVRYRGPRRAAFRVVPVPEDRDIKPGDLVYVKVTDCNAPLPPRTAAPTPS